MPNPTKSLGGFPFFQFIASSAIPSPRCTRKVKGALAFFPFDSKSLGMRGPARLVRFVLRQTGRFDGFHVDRLIQNDIVSVTPANAMTCTGHFLQKCRGSAGW